MQLAGRKSRTRLLKQLVKHHSDCKLLPNLWQALHLSETGSLLSDECMGQNSHMVTVSENRRPQPKWLVGSRAVPHLVVHVENTSEAAKKNGNQLYSMGTL